ncbi:MAG TPA: ATP-binding protein [Saprospiraceae bacterium]|nr:ATP-binding protein [Saprospiraceae bacterium]HMP23426.1 ATP-binding protein [Saprospiraceae bacterium]
MERPSDNYLLSQDAEHKLLRAVSEALSVLLTTNELNLALRNAFRIACEALGCDGVYLFDYYEITPGAIHSRIYFGLRLIDSQWQETPNDLIKFPLETADLQQRVHHMMDANGITIATNVHNPPRLKALLTSLHIHSYLSFRIVLEDKTWGGISFVSLKEDTTWAEGRQPYLMPLVTSIGNFIARKKLEQALQRQSTYLRKIIDLNPNYIFAKNQAGQYTLINQSAAALFEQAPTDIIGKTDCELPMPEQQAKDIIKDDQLVFSTAKTRALPIRPFVDAAGAVHYLQTIKIPVTDAHEQVAEMLGVSVDVTTLKEAEQQLWQQKHFIERIAATVPDIILVVNPAARQFAYHNIGAKILGFETATIDDLFEFLTNQLHPDDQAQSAGFLQQLAAINDAEEIVTKRFRLRHQDGYWAHYYERATVFSRHPDGSIKEYLAVLQDISESVQATQQLELSRQKYRNFVEHSYEGIYYIKFERPIDTALPIEEQIALYYAYGYVEEANTACAQMYGLDDPKVMIGLRMIDAHSGEHFEANRQSTRAFISSGYQVTNSETIEFDTHGNAVYILNHAIGDLRNGCLRGVWGTQQNITEQKKAEQALQKNRQILKAIVNALPDLKFRLSHDGVFLDFYVSEYENETPMLPPQAFLGKRIEEVMPELVAKPARAAIQQAIGSQRVAAFEYSLALPEGVHYYEARVSPMSEHEVIITIRNISEKVSSQQVLQEKMREIDEKNQQLTQYIESNYQLENFAYIASHDLREPVRTMHSFAQLLKRQYHAALDEKGRGYLDFLIYGAENMNRLIEDLLAYSRMSSEEAVFEVVKMPQMMQDIQHNLTTFIEEKQARIHITALPQVVFANRTRLRQLFQNLLTNAIKFHRPELPPEVFINSIEHEDEWLFEIKDNGLGIPLEMQERIFQLFKKIHYHREHYGTGIGLALCKRIVAQHHGEIWVESVPNRGSSFYFTISKKLN